MKKYFIIIIALVFILTSCKGYREVEILDVKMESFKLVSASKIDLGLGIEINNPANSLFTVTDINGVVYKDDTPFANILLTDKMIIPANSQGVVPAKCRIELLDPMAVLVMGLNIKSWKLDEFKMKIKVTVKKGPFKKSFKLNNIPLDKMAKKMKL